MLGAIAEFERDLIDEELMDELAKVKEVAKP
ncbi:hypothetical protein ACT4US_06890, partial [Bacillus sp. HC-Mk]